jgi:hypothetical protein
MQLRIDVSETRNANSQGNEKKNFAIKSIAYFEEKKDV